MEKKKTKSRTDFMMSEALRGTNISWKKQKCRLKLFAKVEEKHRNNECSEISMQETCQYVLYWVNTHYCLIFPSIITYLYFKSTIPTQHFWTIYSFLFADNEKQCLEQLEVTECLETTVKTAMFDFIGTTSTEIRPSSGVYN